MKRILNTDVQMKKEISLLGLSLFAASDVWFHAGWRELNNFWRVHGENAALFQKKDSRAKSTTESLRLQNP